MKHIDWSSVQERQPGSYNDPVPGGYYAVITRVEDKEDKEYLEIQWDFLGGEYQGFNQDTFSRAGFWPTVLRRSYKNSAVGFFKAFYTSIEKSNPGYTFSDYDVQALVGKRMGVVLGLEEYQKRNGEIGQRLYVYQVRSMDTIRTNDFEIPELKRLKNRTPEPSRSYDAYPSSAPYPHSGYGGGFHEADEDDGDLPF